jgi:hypothetical protein
MGKRRKSTDSIAREIGIPDSPPTSLEQLVSFHAQ